jgi:glycosyltransferase involved in cell wall biosynthesis
LLIVSHPAVEPANQSVYVELKRLGWDLRLVVPSRWRHSFRSAVVAPQPAGGLEDRVIPLRIALPGRPQRHAYLASVARVLRRLRPEIVFLEQEGFSIPALQWAVAAVRARVPFGVQAAENRDRPFPLAARLIRSWVLPRAQFVASRSPAAAHVARRWGAAGQVAVVPHAVPRWDVPAPHTRATFTVGFAGWLVPEKGIWDLVHAVARLDGPVRLFVAGGGPLQAALETTELPNGEIVVRSDFTHDRMPEAYAQMDVLVLPSRTTSRGAAEQFGRVLVEALWCGIPVVGSSCGEIPWVVESTGGGLVFPEGDVAALADVLTVLRDHPQRRYELARRGRKRVEQMFSTEAAAAALDDLLIRVLEGRR